MAQKTMQFRCSEVDKEQFELVCSVTGNHASTVLRTAMSEWVEGQLRQFPKLNEKMDSLLSAPFAERSKILWGGEEKRV